MAFPFNQNLSSFYINVVTSIIDSNSFHSFIVKPGFCKCHFLTDFEFPLLNRDLYIGMLSAFPISELIVFVSKAMKSVQNVVESCDALALPVSNNRVKEF